MTSVRGSRRFHFGIVFLLAASLFSAACDPATQASGVIRDQKGDPIADVTITMYSVGDGPGAADKKESEQKSSADGKFNFVTITPAVKKVWLTFKKDGFISVDKEIPGNAQSTVDVVLEPTAN